MDKSITDSVPSIISILCNDIPAGLNAFLGFDACIDNIVRVIKERDGKNKTGYFSDSRQFGEYLIKRADKSCGIELETVITKAGGNMVISANALGNLGVRVDCVGTFGFPDILPIFMSVSPNCSLHTVGDTITANALEFENNKIILFDPGPYRDLDWPAIKTVIGVEDMTAMISGKKLVAFLNWSEIENSSEIWMGVHDEILPHVLKPSGERIFFSDLSDCSRKSRKEILDVLSILAKFRKYFKVVLSLNQNEAELVAAAVNIKNKVIDNKFIKELHELTYTDIIVIHGVDNAVSFDGNEIEKCATFLCSEPAVLTGGGDNFNAGFCFGLLMGLDLLKSTIVANAVSGHYVKTGISPGIEELIKFLHGI